MDAENKPVTEQDLHNAIDSLGRTALRVKIERDALFVACKRAYEELDDRYDVDRDSEGGHKEYPFNGAGELMRILKEAIDKAERE